MYYESYEPTKSSKSTEKNNISKDSNDTQQNNIISEKEDAKEDCISNHNTSGSTIPLLANTKYSRWLIKINPRYLFWRFLVNTFQLKSLFRYVYGSDDLENIYLYLAKRMSSSNNN